MITIASARPPVATEMTAAAPRSATGNDLNCSANMDQPERGTDSGRMLGPNRFKSFLLRRRWRGPFHGRSRKSRGPRRAWRRCQGSKDLLLPMDDLFSYAPPRWTRRAGAPCGFAAPVFSDGDRAPRRVEGAGDRRRRFRCASVRPAAPRAERPRGSARTRAYRGPGRSR